MKSISATVLALLSIATLGLAQAQEASQAPTTPDSVPGGDLRVAGDPANPRSFPLKHTEVHAEITGSVAQVRVDQVFQNPYDRIIEAIYVFPLPHRAAVDDMEIRLGDRTIRGTIERREEARAIYEKARSSGRAAALLDQERPNIFTQSVANILPGEEIVVSLRYFDLLPYESGSYEFVFPMVVGPRFIPGEPVGKQGSGWSADTSVVPDASRITPPVLKSDERSGRDIAVEIDLKAGIRIQALSSRTHKVEIERPAPDQARIRLRPEDAIPNKDFVMRYRIDGAVPGVVMLPHRTGKQGNFLLLIQPEAKPWPEHIMPKEMVFVVDCSGSMSGFPIEKVKEAMHYALDSLNPLDNFQIIRFSNQAESFAQGPVPASPAHVALAHAYVDGLSGAGGTIMLEGVKTALSYPEDPQRLRIISFMTDGYIGNETQILDYLRKNLGGARLFSFGVGSSPNRFLLEKMAEFGRGGVQYLLPNGNVTEAIQGFYDRIRNPYLTDISVDWGTAQVSELFPKEVPDLFLGQSVTLFGAYEKPGSAEITLRGRLGGKPYEQKLRVELPEQAADGEAIGTLWARSKIEELSDRMIESPQSSIVEEITQIAMEHRLVSSYTSFVAVEEQPRTNGEQPAVVPVPVPLPEGMKDPEAEKPVLGGVVGGVVGGVIGGVLGGVPGGIPGPPPSPEKTRGPYNERVRVEGKEEGVSTGSTRMSTTITSEYVSGLPMLGTDYQDVLTLAPGVIDAGKQACATVRGSRDTEAVGLVDGVNTSNVTGGKQTEIEGLEATLSSVGAQQTAPRQDSLFLFLRTARTGYRVGEPIEILVAIKNLSLNNLMIPDALSVEDGSSSFRILDDAGNILDQPEPGICLERKRTIAPGAWFVYRLVLNGAGRFQLDRPGVYQVRFLGFDAGLPDSTLLLKLEP
ncbi:MAG TPA: VIT domain-containing protein [Candidatus Polarisedimenticolia bacterium]|nr:VIT domain-containing protein [Candidatus Polarisedimenticolia bacterium]